MKKVFSLIIILLFLLYVGGFFWVNHSLHRLCNGYFNSNSLKIRCENVTQAMLDPLHLGVKGLHFKFGDEMQSFWQVRAHKLDLDISFKSLFTGLVILKNVQLIAPRVELSELVPITKRNRKNGKFKLSAATLADFHIKKGTFVYRSIDRSFKKEVAVVKIKDIDIDGEDLAFSKDLRQPIHVHGVGHLGRGDLDLDISVDSLSPPQAKIKAKVMHAPLEDINSYTENSESLSLHGEILDSIAVSSLQGEDIHTTMKVQYRDLEADVTKSDDRGAFEAALSDLYLNWSLCNKKDMPLRKMAAEKVSYHRAANDSWAQFYLMGLLKAALAVSCAKDAMD